MTIILKNKHTLIYKDFEFKCSIGLNGLSRQKKEGDKKTPKGTFSLGDLYYRSDRQIKPETKLKAIKIKKKMGWCDDSNNKKYNQPVNDIKRIKCEKLFRKDSKYDFLIPINYNTPYVKKNKGSAIFIHLTKNYRKTLGCIALKKNDLIILIKLIDNKTKIKII